jgi:hypothetical protein
MSITIDLENFVTYINFKYVSQSYFLIIKDSSTLRASSLVAP